jgi:hypothetical protein
MCAEKNNGKNEKNGESGCCDGMEEMMKNCCSDGISGPDCFAKMKEMKDKFCGQNDDGKEPGDSKGCCG